MSLEKTAVLILTGVIAVLLGVAIYSAKKGKANGQGTEVPAVTGGTSSGDPAKKSDIHVFSQNDLREAARREREKKPDMDKVKKGGYSTDALRKVEAEQKAKAEGKTPAADTVENLQVTVKPGETYAKIARRVLGNAALAGRVREANGNIDDRKLKAGMTFTMKVPKKNSPKKNDAVADGKTDTKGAAKKPSGSGPNAKYIDYVIQKNDNYAKIAKKVYGDPARKDDVRVANKNIDENRLRYGARIRIPVDGGAQKGGEAKTAALTRDTVDSIEDF